MRLFLNFFFLSQFSFHFVYVYMHMCVYIRTSVCTCDCVYMHIYVGYMHIIADTPGGLWGRAAWPLRTGVVDKQS